MNQYGFDEPIETGGQQQTATVESEYTDFLKAHGEKYYELARDWSAKYNYRTRTIPMYHSESHPLPAEMYLDSWVGQRTARWIEEYEGDKPWFMWASFPGPHDPWDAPREFVDFEQADGAGGFAQGDARKRLLLPVLLLAATVLGGIYTGFFTPTEAGAVGAFLALALAMLMRRIDRQAGWRITAQTGQVTAAVCFLIIGASIYGRMLSFSGVPEAITSWVVSSGLGVHGFLFLFCGVLILLGTILDSGSILLVTVPLAFPIAQQFGVDPIHFGLITIVAVEIGLLTPPFGLSAFVVQATLKDQGVTLGDVFRGALPFAVIMASVLALVILFPSIVLAILGR
jgi:hypothetical protein